MNREKNVFENLSVSVTGKAVKDTTELCPLQTA
jgi:hypothetical protein